ncbi:MAG: RimK/LysX family protein [Cytophagaceae bacterium]|nr:RimK/LysX family protein [Cytophagaceae bacterium]
MVLKKIIIGRRDRIDLPDLGITNIKAKIDTGAFTSSLHSSEVKLIKGKPDKLSFTLVGHEEENKEYVTEDFSERNIKNSFGQVERRFVIKTTVQIFNKVILTEFSLSDRSLMKYPVLLGRKFLRDHFSVDVSKLNLSYKQKRREDRKNLK